MKPVVVVTLQGLFFVLAVSMADEEEDGDSDNDDERDDGDEDCFEEDLYEAHFGKAEIDGMRSTAERLVVTPWRALLFNHSHYVEEEYWCLCDNPAIHHKA